MTHWDPDHYLNSASFQQVARVNRAMRRLYLDIKGIEPRSKNAMELDEWELDEWLLPYVLKDLLIL
jgi:hypothetical protein